MKAYIDRRWMGRIAAVGQSGRLEAMIVVEDAAGSRRGDYDGGLVRLVVEDAVKDHRGPPLAVRFFLGANAVPISASGGLIQEVLNSESLVVVGATGMDVILFPDV